VVGGPVRRSVARALRLAHYSRLTNWIQTGNPLPVFLQQSPWSELTRSRSNPELEPLTLLKTKGKSQTKEAAVNTLKT
jgi:hypothetical protein